MSIKSDLQPLSSIELLLAREIEICIGPYHQSDERREALRNLLLALRKIPTPILDKLLIKATQASGLGDL